MKKYKNLYDAFIEFIEGLYYEGFVSQMEQENPELLAFEFEQFKENFS